MLKYKSGGSGLKFQIKNIGAIEKADIEIEGITIIAGENNVGKSTVGKALYAFLHDMDMWEKIYNETCSVRLDRFLNQNSNILDDWCMRVSRAKRKRTTRASQLRKGYAQNVDFRACIEDYQLAEDEESKSEARNSLRKYLKLYCCEYLSLYVRESAAILEKEEGWIQNWIENVFLSIEKIELDEIKIQTAQIEQSLNEVFSQQYRKIDTAESEIVFFDDADRKVCFSSDRSAVTLDLPFRTTNHVFFIESPKLYDYLSNVAYGHVQKEYLRYLMSPNVFKRNRIPSFNVFQEYGAVKEVSKEILSDITDRLAGIMGGRVVL